MVGRAEKDGTFLLDFDIVLLYKYKYKSKNKYKYKYKYKNKYKYKYNARTEQRSIFARVNTKYKIIQHHGAGCWTIT